MSNYWTEERVRELAKRADRIAKTYDPCGYADAEGSVETAIKAIKEDPYSVIDTLLSWVDDLTE
jgi:hypothetical protein